MKKLFVVALLASLSVVAQTKKISSSSEALRPSMIEKVIQLVNTKSEPTQKKVTVVVEELGKSTDVSPRYKIYLGYASYAEMGNMTTEFKLSGNAMEFISAKRTAPGIYEVKFTELRQGDEFIEEFEITQSINTTQVFSDENKARKNCGSSFCDLDLKSSILIKEISKKVVN
jgi:hypothetical protein